MGECPGPGLVGRVHSAAAAGPVDPVDLAVVEAPGACQAWVFGLSVDGECWAEVVGLLVERGKR